MSDPSLFLLARLRRSDADLLVELTGISGNYARIEMLCNRDANGSFSTCCRAGYNDEVFDGTKLVRNYKL
jgi:hypothetical protein